MSLRRLPWPIILLLLLSVACVFGQTAGFSFLDSLDDRAYVTGNPHVNSGLTWEGFGWALKSFHSSNWHPLTWISHMLDVQVFGLEPTGHHLVNVVFHAGNAVLLFLLLLRLTGNPWRCALTAAFFAVHPLHVESVAWVSERKDVLSLFLGLTAVALYLRYLRRPGPWRYCALIAVFGLGLMAKQTLTTLPFVLLLLDFWPLGRFNERGGRNGGWTERRGIFIEKIPLLLMSAASSLMALLAQRGGGMITPFEYIPFSERVGNAILSYARYLGKLVWPIRLSIYYPHPGATLPLDQTIAAAALLTLITFGALRWSARRPWLPVGWFWFLGTMVPMIGFVQLGSIAMADRYTYFSATGVFLAAAWGLAEITRRGAAWRAGVAALVAVWVLCLGAAAHLQTSHWRDLLALYEHATAVDPTDWRSRYILGSVLSKQGRYAQAMEKYGEALHLNPKYAPAYNNRGLIHLRQGRLEDAATDLSEAIRLDQTYEEFHLNLGIVREKQGNDAAAEAEYRQALRILPQATIFATYGRLLARTGRLQEARRMFLWAKQTPDKP